MGDARFDGDSRAPAFGGSAGQKRGETLRGSRGGLSTKAHRAVDAQGHPVELQPTARQDDDIIRAADRASEYEIADKAYHCDEFLNMIADRQSTAMIPSQSGPTVQRRLSSRHYYRRRNLAERCVNRLIFRMAIL